MSGQANRRYLACEKFGFLCIFEIIRVQFGGSWTVFLTFIHTDYDESIVRDLYDIRNPRFLESVANEGVLAIRPCAFVFCSN
jgi:hypothetical protein